MKICFTTTSGQKICIVIPILYNPWWWLQPEPNPFGSSRDTGDFGEVINWVTVSGQTVEWAREAQTLATTVALARRSPEVLKSLRAGIDRAIAHIQSQLPEGATLHIAD
jgi:hypothetical protein